MSIASSRKPSTKESAPDAWERWLPLWHALFALVLAVSSILALTDLALSDERLRVLLFASVLGAWYVVSLRWDAAARPGFLLAYQMTGWLVWFALAHMAPVYMFMLFALFPHLFISLRKRWASIGAVVLTTLVLLRQATLSSDNVDMWLLFMSVATVAGILLAYFVEAIIKESHQRGQLIVKLEAAQRELTAAERRAGTLQERQRLAGEIHDTLAQGLISIITHIEAADNALTADPDAVQRHLNAAQTTARDSLSEVRRFVWELRPPALEHQPYQDAVQRVTTDWSASNQIPAQLIVTGTCRPLMPEQESALLRVIQEALANITKHARAQHVTVTLSHMPQGLVVDIHDDGAGFDPAQIRETALGGFGLKNMRARIERLNGTLLIESAPGEGTTIVAEIPIQP